MGLRQLVHTFYNQVMIGLQIIHKSVYNCRLPSRCWEISNFSLKPILWASSRPSTNTARELSQNGTQLGFTRPPPMMCLQYWHPSRSLHNTDVGAVASSLTQHWAPPKSHRKHPWQTCYAHTGNRPCVVTGMRACWCPWGAQGMHCRAPSMHPRGSRGGVHHTGQQSGCHASWDTNLDFFNLALVPFALTICSLVFH